MAKYNSEGDQLLRPTIALTRYEVKLMFEYLEEKGINFGQFAEAAIREKLVDVADHMKRIKDNKDNNK